MNLVTDEELNEVLRTAIMQAVKQIAPAGGQRSVSLHAMCDCLVELIADILAGSPRGFDQEDLNELAVVFHRKLEEAIRKRQESIVRH